MNKYSTMYDVYDEFTNKLQKASENQDKPITLYDLLHDKVDDARAQAVHEIAKKGDLFEDELLTGVKMEQALSAAETLKDDYAYLSGKRVDKGDDLVF